MKVLDFLHQAGVTILFATSVAGIAATVVQLRAIIKYNKEHKLEMENNTGMDSNNN